MKFSDLKGFIELDDVGMVLDHILGLEKHPQPHAFLAQVQIPLLKHKKHEKTNCLFPPEPDKLCDTMINGFELFKRNFEVLQLFKGFRLQSISCMIRISSLNFLGR